MNANRASLQQLLPEACFHGSEHIAASAVTADSRRITPGDIFVAIRGNTVDGHDHIREAIAGGAAAIVAEAAPVGVSVPVGIVPCSASAFARICMTLKMGDRCPLVFAGVTGTNGKTTTTWMLQAILQQARLQTGLVGTIENHDGVAASTAFMTTPPADVLAEQLGRMVSQRTSHCVMEVSSHGLSQKRCAGLQFSAAAITNITRDHLDYHHTIDDYRAAKTEIAGLLHTDAPLLLNLNDEGCQSVLDQLGEVATVVTYGVENSAAELRATVLSKTHRSQRLRLQLAQGTAALRLRLIGRHNVENALAAAGLAEQLGIGLRDIVGGLESVHAVPGRLQRIDEGQPFQVLVDYAHTPAALKMALETIREFVPGRLICVFGAGGDRDPSKRPIMGRAAASAADLCIVTSDNPRSEVPEEIIRDVVEGISRETAVTSESDRREAIRYAFEEAEPGDVVLLAGKGHEANQQMNGRMMPFDDRIVARQLLQEMYAPISPEAGYAAYACPDRPEPDGVRNI